MKWFVASLFRRGEPVMTGREEECVVQGPYPSDEVRIKKMKRYVADNRDEFRVIAIPIDVIGDREATMEIPEPVARALSR
jgi:hypothetical protein